MKIYTFILGIGILLSLYACSAAKYADASSSTYYDRGQSQSAFEMTKQEVTSETTISTTNKTRKLIYASTLGFEVDSAHLARAKVMQIAMQYNGYMVSSSDMAISIRVPANDREQVIKSLKMIGKLYSENHTGQDVTDAYFDIQLRLENAEKTRKRYLELLEQAQTVEEVLKVEKELERLNEKIELYKGKIKQYDNQIGYSLITVRLKLEEEKMKPGPIGYIFVGLYKGIRWLFVRGG